MPGLTPKLPKIDFKQPTPALPSPKPVRAVPDLRATDDPVALRGAVYDSVLNTARTLEPVVGSQFTLALTDVDYAKDDPTFNKADEKRALIERNSLNRRLRGTWSLIDNATQQEVERKTATIANVPAILHDGTFINKGTRYGMGYQQRLRPGAYTRTAASGEALTQMNIRPRHGRSHRYMLHPETGIFHINVEHAKIPLVPLLDTLGVTKDEMRAAWGDELAEKNFVKVDGRAIGKLYERLVPRKTKQPGDKSDPAAMKAKIREAFDDMLVDPEVVRRTLGRETDKVDADLIMRSTKEILKLAKGERDPDDRDHLAFASFHSAPDIFAERFKHDYDNVRRDLLHKISRKGSLKSVPSAVLDKQISAAIFKSGLAKSVEEISPAEILSAMTSVTRYGEGGLSSGHSTPDESRDVGVGQFGFVDPVSTPESGRIGADGWLARNTFVSKDNKLYTKVLDKKGEEQIISPGELMDSVYSLGHSSIKGFDLAVDKGKMKLIPQGTEDYRLANSEELFGHGAGLVPLKSSSFPQRISMGSRMLAQAVALDNREAPWVQTGIPGQDGRSYEQQIGEKFGAIFAKKPGKVMSVKGDTIKVRYDGGETEDMVIDDNRPGARKTLFHQESMLKPGEAFQPGQLLVKSNYTDDEGTAAVGVNARAAFMALEDNWEDGYVISESLANRMKMQQAYKHRIEPGEGEYVDKRKFVTSFGGKYDARQLEPIGTDGVIAVGTEVRQGDPLLLAVQERNTAKSRVHRKGKSNWRDASVVWDHAHPGVVTDVFASKKGSQVVVRTSKPMETADKLSGTYGNKGVVTVWKDADMPHDEDGNPIDVAVSPLSVPSRGNSSFPISVLLGKIAKKRGIPYKPADFGDTNWQEFAEQEAEKHGVKPTETLTDPRTGRKIPGILTGEMFTMALHHSAESKLSGRGLGRYGAEGNPAKGSEEGAQAKRQSNQDLFALMSHGAYDLSRESSLLRGQRNDDYWAAFMSGNQIGEPTVSTHYEGYLDRMRALGINPVKKGRKRQLMAMRDSDVDYLTNGRTVTVPQTLDMYKDMSPIKGGLFDPKLFGDGDRWAQYDLPEPLPNPVFEEPVRKMLGLTEKKFRDILGGAEELPGYGAGPEAIAKRLGSLDLKVEMNRARKEIAGTKKTARDTAIKRFKFLKGLERTGTSPKDLIVSKVPVLPPRFRPIAEMQGKGGVMVNDANFLYRELMLAGANLGEMQGVSDDVGNERLAVYDAYKALVGLSEPASQELRQRKVKGLLKTVLGSGSPKGSIMQRKLLSGTIDTVGRGVIMVDSNLDMDSVGIPEKLAFKVYEPYIVRNMVQSGIPRLQAMQHLEDKDSPARTALIKAMKDRPVVLSRAPVLHKYGIISLEPHLVKGDAIRTPPLIAGGLNADFDGDAVNISVPHGARAVMEAKNRMTPSKMLISPSDFASPMFTPSQDMLLGLFQSSTNSNKPKQTRIFRSLEDAKRAFNKGELNVNDPVKIIG